MIAAFVGFFSPPSLAADGRIPRFFDAGARLPTPALSTIQQLRFVTTGDFPPFNMIGPTGNPAGFNIDLAREICRELGLVERCSVQILPLQEALTAVKAGQAEVFLAGMAVSPETRRDFTFSQPYMMLPARFVTKASVGGGNWNEKRVGVVAGSAHERLLRDYFPGAKPITYAKRDWILDDLRADKIDAAFDDGMTLSLWLNSEKGRECCVFADGPFLAPEYLGLGLSVAVHRDGGELAATFDYALRELERKGVTGELYLRYFPVGFF